MIKQGNGHKDNGQNSCKLFFNKLDQLFFTTQSTFFFFLFLRKTPRFSYHVHTFFLISSHQKTSVITKRTTAKNNNLNLRYCNIATNVPLKFAILKFSIKLQRNPLGLVMNWRIKWTNCVHLIGHNWIRFRLLYFRTYSIIITFVK